MALFAFNYHWISGGEGEGDGTNSVEVERRSDLGPFPLRLSRAGEMDHARFVGTWPERLALLRED